MDPKVVLAALNGALGLVESLGPLVQKMVQAGEISKETQQEVDDRISALRPGGVAFAGPEWNIEPS